MIREAALRFARERVSVGRRQRLKRFLATHLRPAQHWTFRVLAGSDLGALALLYGTDKNSVHRYTEHYERHLADFRRRPVRLLEIGVGGQEDPATGGGSLRMWRTYFPKGRIYGIDIHDKSPHDERRIRTFKGSQGDLEFLGRVLECAGSPDIVIDDGSHRCEHVIATFEYLFPRMSARGVYAVEDVQTSYWRAYGGDDVEPDRPDTTMGHFMRLLHGINHAERPSRVGREDYFERNIRGVSFYHNLIVVEKGPNDEPGGLSLPQNRDATGRAEGLFEP